MLCGPVQHENRQQGILLSRLRNPTERAARARLMNEKPKPRHSLLVSLGACSVVGMWILFCTYTWVEFVKLCVWAGQFTWP
jgi:hypothetical protein